MNDTRIKKYLFEVIEKKDLKELECFLNDSSTATYVNTQDRYRETPLNFVCRYWEDSELKFRAMELLLERGADVNIQNEYGNTPLHRVCWAWKDSHLATRAMELLFSRGADVNIQNKNGYTPLHLTCCLSWRDSELKFRAMELLLDRGTDVNIQNEYGNTPLHLMCLRTIGTELEFRVLELLLSRQSSQNCDVNIQNGDGDTPLELLQKHNPNTKMTKFLEDWITHFRVRSLRGLIIKKIKEIKIPTEGIPDICLEFPDELLFSKDLKC